MEFNSQKIAAKLWQARLDGTLVPVSMAEGIDSLNTAYAVQAEQQQLSGLEVVGWKLGATNPLSLKTLGLDEPFAGRLYDSTVHRSGDTVPLHPIHAPQLETEFAITIGAALPSRNAPYERTDIIARIAKISPGFEVVASRFGPDLDGAGLRAIADGGVNTAVTIGEGGDWRNLDLLDVSVDVVVNDRLHSGGNTAARLIWADPIEAVVWLANSAAVATRGLRPGDVVMTGTFVDLIPVAPGDRATADFGAMGSVEIEFKAA